MKFPFMSDKINNVITSAFRKRGLNIVLAQRSHTLRNELRPPNNYSRICNKNNCPVEDGKTCYRNKVVYQIVCLKCQSLYIGSTKRYLHTRIKEHLSDQNSSLSKHLYNCGNSRSKYIRITIKHQCQNVIDMQIAESLYIKKLKPKINSRDELNKHQSHFLT